jgi:hypothetical protein
LLLKCDSSHYEYRYYHNGTSQEKAKVKESITQKRIQMTHKHNKNNPIVIIITIQGTVSLLLSVLQGPLDRYMSFIIMWHVLLTLQLLDKRLQQLVV